ncbi:hypothetical protein ABIC63_005933 [Pseudacidovorax sp. 1753]|uniref:Mu transposase domain-containing protein n=1 Tax=Pseudacidovorax sp. 1753 TaxID=3156419 RepID=UPI003399A012
MFAAIDTPALRPPPRPPWTWALWQAVTVHIDFHVEVEGHRYSVAAGRVRFNDRKGITSNVTASVAS